MGKVSKPNFGARLLDQIKEVKAERAKPETAEDREARLARADAALEQIGPAAGNILTRQTTGAAPTVSSTPTVDARPTVGLQSTVGKPTVEPLVKPTVDAAPTVGAPPTVRIAVEAKKGQLRIPNHIVFNLLPQLSLAERAVYLELYAWTHGFGEPERRLSIAKLCKGLGIDYKRFMRIVDGLASKGLVVMDERVIGGPRNDRGTVFRIHEPMVIASPGAEPTVGGSPTVGGAPNMKRKHEKHIEKAPAADAPAVDVRAQTIGTLRAIARSYRHSTPDVKETAVRARLRQWFESEGRVIDDAMIDEALTAAVR